MCSAATAGAAALLLGAIALRIRGLYLALVTLVFGSVFADAIFTLPSLNGQDAGVSAYRPTAFATEYRYYLFTLAMVFVSRSSDPGPGRRGGAAIMNLTELLGCLPPGCNKRRPCTWGGQKGSPVRRPRPT